MHRNRPDLRLISSRSPQVNVRHPDTRQAQVLPLGEFMFRVEQCLDVTIVREWIPALVAMADGLFVRRDAALWRARAGRGLAEGSRLAERTPVADSLIDDLVEAGVVQRLAVEEIFRQGLWDSLERPRTWELNGWWEALYGVVPMPPWEEDDDPEAEEEEDADSLPVGKSPHPYGLQSPDNQVRLLLEQGQLTQGEPLFRLKISIYEQTRALAALREGWSVDGAGNLALPAEGSVPEAQRQALALSLAQMNRRGRSFDRVALGHLVRLGLVSLRDDVYMI